MENINKTVGFIGCGNMGGALARAAAKAGYKPLLSDVCTDKATALANETGGTVSDNMTVAKSCGYIFLAVKPQMLADTVGEIKDILLSRKDGFVLVSMAAGVSIQSIKQYAGDLPIIRIMPNTPASVGEGTVLYCTDGVTDEQTDIFCDILKKAGMVDRLPEKLIDAASALSGCGPAFVFQFINALADGAVRCGLPRDKAIKYAEQTVLGSARLAIETGQHPSVLRDAVCSPAGSTIEGVRALAANGMDSAVTEAVIASYERTLELGK